MTYTLRSSGFAIRDGRGSLGICNPIELNVRLTGFQIPRLPGRARITYPAQHHIDTSSNLRMAVLRLDREAGRAGKRRRPYECSSLVVVDEVGYTPIDREECNLFYQFVAMRYEKMSTIITSNKAFDEWSELFHDPVIVAAILDRLLHHSVVVNIKGNSYRLKGKLSAAPDVTTRDTQGAEVTL